MNVISKPRYYSYLDQVEDPFFSQVWGAKRQELSADLSWIDKLEIKDGEVYSRDYDHNDFPTYYNWPKNWRAEFESAKSESHVLKSEHLAQAEVHHIDDDVIYILDEEVWFSTSHYCYGDICKMQVSDRNKDVEFDSVVTAAYAYINDFKEWEQSHGKAYEAANILSKIERPFTDSLIGTTQECDFCGSFAVIVKEDENGNAICSHCA